MSVLGHIGNDYLPSGDVPEIVNAQAAPRIARVAAVLDVPVGGVRLALTPNPEFVGARGRISNPRFKHEVS